MGVIESRDAAVRAFDALRHKDLDEFESLHVDDFVDHDPGPGEIPTPAGRREFFLGIQSSFPDWDQQVQDVIAEGDKVVIRWIGRGTHEREFPPGVPATGKQVAVQGIAVFRMEDGKMAERWAVVDQFGMMKQLGVISDKLPLPIRLMLKAKSRARRPAKAAGPMPSHDYQGLLQQEMKDMSAFLDGLADDQWDAPTLCDGWRVRDVVGHVCGGYATALALLPVKMARSGFNPRKVQHQLAIDFASARTAGELKDAFRRIADTAEATGLARIPPSHERFADHLIHHQDIRLPLGMPRHIPEERLVAALDALPRIGGLFAAKKNTVGIRFSATDVGWEYGQGLEVSGPADALIMAIGGRPVGLAQLSGDGVSVLQSRMAG